MEEDPPTITLPTANDSKVALSEMSSAMLLIDASQVVSRKARYDEMSMLCENSSTAVQFF